MHEMALAQNLIHIIRREMEKNDAKILYTVKIKAGCMNAVVPQALETAFRTLTEQTPLQDARLEVETLPLKLRCGSCGEAFHTSTEDTLFLTAECPECGRDIGHSLLQGQELFIEYLEAE